MDLHTGLASPRALELAGVTGPVAFDEASEVVCEGGRPTGELREWAAMDLVRAAIPALTDEDRHRLYVAQLRRFAALGITGTHAMDGSLATTTRSAASRPRATCARASSPRSGSPPRRRATPGRSSRGTATPTARGGAAAWRSSSSTG